MPQPAKQQLEEKVLFRFIKTIAIIAVILLTAMYGMIMYSIDDSSDFFWYYIIGLAIIYGLYKAILYIAYGAKKK